MQHYQLNLRFKEGQCKLSMKISNYLVPSKMNFIQILGPKSMLMVTPHQDEPTADIVRKLDQDLLAKKQFEDEDIRPILRLKKGTSERPKIREICNFSSTAE